MSAQTAVPAVYNLTDTINYLGSPELRWDPFFDSGVLNLNGHNASFYSGEEGETGPVLFDNREILDLPLPYNSGGELFFPASFVTGVNDTFKRFAADDLARFRIAAIVIDPGHGGKDTGAIGNHIIKGVPFQSVEKDIVLKVSKLLYSRLAAAFPDKRILMTRDSDTFPSLEDRVILANGIPVQDNEAIIYISVHANASLTNPAARGYEIWYLPPDYQRDILDKSKYSGSPEIMPILNDMIQEEYNTESVLLSQGILRQFNSILGNVMPSRGLKEEAWFVVRNAHMPSVLVELGFVTNETDALLMNDDNYLVKFSDALYNGITEFVDLFERSGGFTAQY
ncbi:MAG: N-acetylmuramoyl-L-alanine amidase [Treponema sp.]|nr:N-acetylmuramoyl-L-alanine amidase [Treponema sp.]